METRIAPLPRLSLALTFRESAFYAWSAAFILGNLILPQLCHFAPGGGKVFLPIYFFTLIGAWRFGLQVGLLTALASPVINSVLFGMPPANLLPAIVVKSLILAVLAAFAAQHIKNKKLLLPALLGVVAGYQLIGGLCEFALTGSLDAALQDARIAWPGMLIQIAGGFALLLFFKKNSADTGDAQ